MATHLTPILTRFWDDPQSWTLETYERNEGYQALRGALLFFRHALDQTALHADVDDGEGEGEVEGGQPLHHLQHRFRCRLFDGAHGGQPARHGDLAAGALRAVGDGHGDILGFAGGQQIQ